MFADTVLKALSNYPIVESAVALLILLAGWRVMNAGKRDGPAPPAPSYATSHEFPLWLMSGPVHDAMTHVASMKHEMIRQRELMEELLREAARTRQALEMIQNENLINPRRLRE